MGAASCGLPTIAVSGGPMLNGRYKGREVGSGTDVWRFGEDVKAGRMTLADFLDAEAGMARSVGSCMTMGTASTMASMVEALGIGMPGNAAIPAADFRRKVLAQLAGRRIVDLVKDDVTIDKILTREAFENAIRVNAAIGGSTNAVLHLIALAGRLDVSLGLDDWDRLGRGVPTIVDLMPSGRFLMEDFYYAGGLPVVIKALGENGLLHRDALTVSGRTIWEDVAAARELRQPCHPLVRRSADGGGRRNGRARQSCAGRRGAEAVRRDAGADAAHRAGRRISDDRRLSSADRRSGARHRRELRNGPEELRSARLSRHGGGRATWACRRKS